MRKVPFENGEYYHIYNRGVDKREIFTNKEHYFRFLRSLKEFNQVDPIGSLFLKDLAVGQLKKLKKIKSNPESIKKIVTIISFCLLPNHFHFILRQEKDGGISEFMKRVGGGYTQFFNFQEKRTGALFQGRFKSIHIDSNEYLLYLSAYINGNGNIHKITKEKVFCSMDYIKSNLVQMDLILGCYKSIEEYKDYVKKVSCEIKTKREELKKLIIEEWSFSCPTAKRGERLTDFSI